MLESELKAKSDHIRTIIKARGISYPNITGKTFAVFRVDNRHHLMSIVSMIDPSPDWVVGVSNLELCLRNCTWTESRVLNLYPWDVGTDDGVTYMSPNQPSSPRQAIRRLRTNYPNDPRSPFFDPTGTPMKPLARLILSRQRLYEKSCDSSGSDDSENSAANCDTTEWSEWSPCSATCGKGMKYKQRRYKNEESKYICHRKLTERASCEAVERYCPPPVRIMEDPMCELGPWSEWSSCSVTCGKGVQTRDRKYKNRLAAKTCSAFKTNPPILQQNLECWGEEICDDYEEEPEIDCPHRPWSDWSPCSATCGKGFKERYRIALDSTDPSSLNWPFFKGYKTSDDEEEFDEEDPCNNLRVRETVECLQRPCPEQTKQKSELACTLPKDVGECKSNVDRWYFDILKGNCEIFTYSGCEGNDNNFNTLEQCQTLCAKYQREFMLNSTMWKKHLGVTLSSVLQYNIQNDAINANADDAKNKLGEETLFFDDINLDCEVSKWSNWSSCNVTNGVCGWGFKEKRRTILVHPKNDGFPCPKKLVKHKQCHVSCQKKKKSRVRTGCVMSEWSPWSKCNEGCENQYQHRFRHVLVYPKEAESKCQNEVEHRPCPCY
nr:unnamed protein product [Callosobruchus chinensis]